MPWESLWRLHIQTFLLSNETTVKYWNLLQQPVVALEAVVAAGNEKPENPPVVVVAVAAGLAPRLPKRFDMLFGRL